MELSDNGARHVIEVFDASCGREMLENRGWSFEEIRVGLKLQAFEIRMLLVFDGYRGASHMSQTCKSSDDQKKSFRTTQLKLNHSLFHDIVISQ